MFFMEADMPEGKMTLDRRMEPRVPVKLPIRYLVVEDEGERMSVEAWRRSGENAYTLDMSVGGMLIGVDRPLARGSILKFDIYIPEAQRTVGVYAEVVWSGKAHAGLKFLMIKNDDLELLSALLGKNPQVGAVNQPRPKPQGSHPASQRTGD